MPNVNGTTCNTGICNGAWMLFTMKKCFNAPLFTHILCVDSLFPLLDKCVIKMIKTPCFSVNKNLKVVFVHMLLLPDSLCQVGTHFVTFSSKSGPQGCCWLLGASKYPLIGSFFVVGYRGSLADKYQTSRATSH